jgi:hypothetical protein
MSHRLLARVAVCVAGACGVLALTVAGAAASEASIKAAIVSFSPRIQVAEGHLLSAIGEYNTSKDPAGVESALGTSIGVFSALKAKLAIQAAIAPHVKQAKSKVQGGLQEIISGYSRLKVAYGERAVEPQAAEAEAVAAVRTTDAGRAKLTAGLSLLR